MQDKIRDCFAFFLRQRLFDWGTGYWLEQRKGIWYNWPRMLGDNMQKSWEMGRSASLEMGMSDLLMKLFRHLQFKVDLIKPYSLLSMQVVNFDCKKFQHMAYSTQSYIAVQFQQFFHCNILWTTHVIQDVFPNWSWSLFQICLFHEAQCIAYIWFICDVAIILFWSISAWSLT